MARVLIFLLAVHQLIFLPNPVAILAAESTNKSEIEALLSFQQGLTDDPLGVLSSWTHDTPYCRWKGVVCGKALPLRVVSLQLNSLQLRGVLSSSLANLSSITRLDLGNNSFTGGIPEELGTLPQLQDLILAYNSLTGLIPNSLATSSSLTVLNLTSNSLSGTIPTSLFNGSSQLAVIDLGRNSLSGSIPDFYKMETLQILNLAKNNLSGSIPPSLGNVSSLREIDLYTNSLGGSIPETLSRIWNLSVLNLGNNLFGYVPAGIYNISSLRTLDLSNNSITGPIPSRIGNSLPILEKLITSGNIINGSIPASLANASKLQVIDLSYNSLAGPVPLLGSSHDLLLLDLQNNILESDNWQFIASLANCPNLKMLLMNENRLDGSLPISVGNLSSSLQRLDLGNNRISGPLPEEIGNLPQLQLLAMDQNWIVGEIPSSIGKLSTLVVLRLSHNILSGQITPLVGDLQQLTELSLDRNNLTGKIPASLGQCQRLTLLNLTYNNLDGQIPTELLNITTLFSLDLSKNCLTGSIPNIGFINLVILNISHNLLSGKIPPSLGQCRVLSSLLMQSNQLDGMIPHSFIDLKAIQKIDLSQNNLTGQIPDFFNNFSTLEQLDLSDNNFEGPVPTSGYFLNISVVNLYGNTKLCASVSIFALPICPTTSTVKSKNARLLLIVIAPIIIALFSILIFMVTHLKKRAPITPCYKETMMKKVSYGDILKATNWLSPVNKISSSHTSSIYIGRFEFDTDLVAIKVFHLDELGSLNSFLMECSVLRNTRHRNLMKAVTLCSTVSMENDEFKAIVFDFMANGSLDMWVHPKLHKNSSKRCLSLDQRIRIAMDVASALDYMHNQLTPPLIHCDLKPANVLLDYDMTARVGDFGSAKFLSSDLASSQGFVSVGGTIGYIAPEYGMGCKISTGCDVYSFGVLLLEMLTGMRPTDAMFTDGMSLHRLVSSAYPNGLGEVLDPYMCQEGHHTCATISAQKYVMPLVEVALSCSMELPKGRPGMRDVCAKLFAINEAFHKP
ncbi:probable LRR receptor-like serine/threonine-protein kinase At3g47570 [Panicum hallii]|nr:probable LRR receptor-like serine/threonine-protein kinase At3g47570 [Panicum hallii]